MPPVQEHDYPIIEFDPTPGALIEPSKVLRPVAGMPERCVLPMYATVIRTLLERGILTHVTDMGSSMGALPVYRLEHRGVDVAVAHPGLGAPFAAAVMEELIAFGCRTFIACGDAGVVDGGRPKGSVVVPNCAIRDEGTSYHYVPPAKEIDADPAVVAVIEDVLRERGVEYRLGKTWTTDAIYRETRDRIARRAAEGCITVEMECAAFIAVARFRGVRFGQLLAISDDVSGEVWGPRHADHEETVAERLFWWSVEACVRL